MAKQTKAQQKTVERVMHAFKEGDLEQNGGETVKDPKQAIAIALREAGASNEESPTTNRRALARTKTRERAGATAPRDDGETRDALYAEAKRRDIAGRSGMSKAQLKAALGR